MVIKVVSGGQTGADMGGLLGARDCGIETGGYAPHGFRTEAGPTPELAAWGLTETSDSGYHVRTRLNAQYADGTVIFGRASSSGSRMTIELCKQMGKPYIVNPTPAMLFAFVQSNRIAVLNVAGNRESRNPGIQEGVRKIIRRTFETPETKFEQERESGE